MWRRPYNYELYHLYKDSDIVRLIKMYRLRWIGHIEEGQSTKHIFYQKTMGSRKRGRPRSRFKDQVEAVSYTHLDVYKRQDNRPVKYRWSYANL